MDDDHVLVAIVHFEDDRVVGHLLHRGTRSECLEMQDTIPAITVDERPVFAKTMAMPASDWDALVFQSEGCAP